MIINTYCRKLKKKKKGDKNKPKMIKFHNMRKKFTQLKKN